MVPKVFRRQLVASELPDGCIQTSAIMKGLGV